ncbi:MAG: hypothetical protein EBZ69_09085 [Alphaproteobacteria bacterium]|nr:hypothetical protein [Alphaproteobacteria bacterium]NDC56938.1 hypothetical protein [Alphaproteobacteria bacterium]NDG05239.1 hypothetical protein [Alphaproteobacteria bacterium]
MDEELGKTFAKKLKALVEQGKAKVVQLPPRLVSGDVRMYDSDTPRGPIQKGDLMAMSTRGLVYVIDKGHGLTKDGLTPADDINGADFVDVGTLGPQSFKHPGHFLMLCDALAATGQLHQLKEENVPTKLKDEYNKQVAAQPKVGRFLGALTGQDGPAPNGPSG